jgi:putative membrane protein
MKRALPAAIIVCAFLTLPAIAANKKKTPTPPPTPSTLPPTSPMIASPAAADSSQPGSSSQLISSEMSGRDLEFFTNAVDAGREQAFYIGLLKTKASSDQIKSLADALGTTQEEENSHIAKLAALKGWNVSLEPTAALKKSGDDLEKLSGSNLDKAAMDKIVAASKKAMSAYEEAAESNDKEIKIFAAQMLPLAEEKRHVVEKMTGVGSKAAAQLFRNEKVAATPTVTPSPVIPAPTPAASPAAKSTPATPAEKEKGKGKGKGKRTPTPPPTPTPTPAASTAPIATPPGQSANATPVPDLPAIIPSKAPASVPRPIPPPIQ